MKKIITQYEKTTSECIFEERNSYISASITEKYIVTIHEIKLSENVSITRYRLIMRKLNIIFNDLETILKFIYFAKLITDYI